jgi:fructose-bisphosphate aldolase class II
LNGVCGIDRARGSGNIAAAKPAVQGRNEEGKELGMARITLRQLLDHAAEHSYGVPAFNINNMEQGLSIMEAAAATNSPVILQASRGARAYANDVVLAKLIDALVELHPDIPVCMHLDHGNNEATCATAMQHGFTSVMMDGSLKEDGKTPADYAYNAGITRRVTDMAHWGGVSVEGEIGVLGSLEHGGGEQEDGHGAEGGLSHDQLLTDPEQAAQFVRDTQVDALAVAMGTSHGAYKFSRKPDGDVLAMNVIEEIHRRLPDTHLVMHGSSSVPVELQEIINKYGGQMKPTWGVPVEEIQRGIKHGVRKINIDTDNRMAMTGAIRKVLSENPSEFDPRKYLVPAMAAMKKLCIERFEAFGTAGNAGKIKVVSLAEMAKRYKSGSLAPKIT